MGANLVPTVPFGVTSAGQLAEADLNRFLGDLPNISRPIIAKWFRRNPKTTQKADLSPVTIADRQIEIELRRAINAAFPDDAIKGEEYDTKIQHGESQFCWIIDPIDGTKAFISGKPVFGTLVGLTKSGLPLAGLVDLPVLDETYVGHITGEKLSTCKMNSAVVRPSKCKDLASARIATTSPKALSKVGLFGFDQLAAKAQVVNYGGDCHNYALLASGHLDLVMEDNLASHDIIAVVAIMQAAGVIVTDTNGNPIKLEKSSSILAAATNELHSMALSTLSRANI